MESSDEFDSSPERIDDESNSILKPLWTHKNTAILIKCRLANEHLFKSRSTANSGWRTVLSNIQSSTGNKTITISNISKKWSNLCRIYKDYKKFLTTNKIPWLYFEIFDNYYNPKKKDNDKNNCRLCQKETGVHSLKNDTKLADYIEKHLDLKLLHDSEDLPDVICFLCKLKIDNFHSFWLQCLEVDTKLRTPEDANISETIPPILNQITIQDDTDTTCPVNETFENSGDEYTSDDNYILDDEDSYSEDSKVEDVNLQSMKNKNTGAKGVTIEPSLEEIFNINKDDPAIPIEDSLDCFNFNNENSYSIESHIAEINKEFTCNICFAKFISKGRLNKHLKYSHHKRKCNVEGCDKVYTFKQSLDRHFLRDHEGVSLYLCTICGKGCNTRTSLKTHEKQHKGIRDYACDMCEKTFYCSTTLLIHKKKDHLNVVYFCSQCTKSFRSSSALTRHEIVHTGIRDFTCEICKNAFYTKRELIVHGKRHEGKRPYNCSVCYKAFMERHHLRDHEKIHTGERPYSCLSCSRRFINKSKLNQHMKTHSNE